MLSSKLGALAALIQIREDVPFDALASVDMRITALARDVAVLGYAIGGAPSPRDRRRRDG